MRLSLIFLFFFTVLEGMTQEETKCFVRNVDIISYFNYRTCESCLRRHPKCENVCKQYYWICYATNESKSQKFYVAEDISRATAQEKALNKCLKNNSSCRPVGCTNADRIISTSPCKQ